MSARDRDGKTIYSDSSLCTRGEHEQCAFLWCSCNCHSDDPMDHDIEEMPR